MTFESYDMKVVHPLDLYQDLWYIELAYENMEQDVLDKLYTMTAGNGSYFPLQMDP